MALGTLGVLGFVVTGWAVPLAVAGIASTAAMASALVLSAIRHVGTLADEWQGRQGKRLSTTAFITLVGLGSGLVAFPLSMVIEQAITGNFVTESTATATFIDGHRLQLWLAGPIEETCKLLLPLALWFLIPARMRDPRTGFLVAMVSGATYGVLEGCLSAVTMALAAAREGGGPAEIVVKSLIVLLQRPSAELLHPLLAAGVAALAWRAAWERRSILTWTLAGAAIVAMAIHSVNDGVIADLLPGPLQLLVLPVVLVGTYLLFTKRGARELVPPSRIPGNPPGWRPRFLRMRRAAA